MMKLILPLLFGASLCYGSLTDVYIASAAAGLDTGTNCANAHALAFFNTGANWGALITQIGPGTTVHHCGTTTTTNGTTALTFQGSGTVGNPITLVFESGSILQAGYFAASGGGFGGGAIAMSSFGSPRSYVTVSGGTSKAVTGDTNGIIRNTANGDGLTNQQDSIFFTAFECDNCTVKNLHLNDVYIHNNPTSQTTDETKKSLIELTGSHWVFSGNQAVNCGWCILNSYTNGNTDFNIFQNEISSFTHGWALMGTQAGGPAGTNFFFHDNYLHDTSNWDTNLCNYHHDGIHIFGAGGSTISGLYVYNNKLSGNWGQCQTGQVFVEAGSSDAGLSNSAWFNNIFIETAGTGPSFTGMFGLFSGHSGTTQVYDNVCIHNTANDGTTCFYIQFITGLKFKNNAADLVNSPLNVDSSTYSGADINFNFYGNSCSGGNCFSKDGSFSGSFAGWKTACGCDANSVQNNTSLLSTTTGAPSSGSPVITVATNLSGIASGNLAALLNDTSAGDTRTPIARGSSWDAGAFQFGAAPPDLSINVITSPVGRSITVDSVTATAPQAYTWTPSTSHTIAVTTPQTVSTTRYVFASWSDSGAVSHTVTPSVDTNYTATFTTQYQLTTSGSGGGTVTLSSGVSGDFYNSGTGLTLTAVPNAGKMFSAWTGDASGSTNPLSVTMSAAKSITATFTDSTVSIKSITSTNTQAIITYTVSDSSSCTVKVSTDPTFATLFYDVDPALYTNGDLDSARANVTGSGGINRQMVIGKRRAVTALNGIAYSLALQSSTGYYAKLFCTSGTATATRAFTTDVGGLPGMGYEHFPFDSTLPNNYAVPTINLADRTKSYVDPLTGVSMTPMTIPGEVGHIWFQKSWLNPDFYKVIAGTWVTPENFINGSTIVQAVTSSVGTAVIFAPIDPNLGDVSNSGFCTTGGYWSNCGVNDVGYRLIANAATNGNQVQVCLTNDGGQTCYTSPITVSLTTSITDFGLKWGTSSSPSGSSAGWSKSIFRSDLNQWGVGDVVAGVVTLTTDWNGSPISTATNTSAFSALGSFFDPTWAVGSAIYIEGSSPTCTHNLCTTASITDATHLVLSETGLTVSGKNIKSAQFGIRLAYTSGTGAINVTLSKYGLAAGDLRRLPPSGNTDHWSPATLTAGDGARGFIGVHRTSDTSFSQVHFIDSTTGEYRILGVLKPPTTIAGYAAQDLPHIGGGGPTPDVSVFDSSGVIRVSYPCAGSPPRPLCYWKLTYTGNYSAVSGYGYFNDTGLNNNSYPTETGFTWENLTKPSQSRDINSQISNITCSSCIYGQSNWFPSRLNLSTTLTFFGSVGEYGAYYQALTGQDSPHAFFIFDGNGTLYRAFNTWDGSLNSAVSPRIGFTGVHTLDQVGSPNTVGIFVDAAGGFAAGQEYAGPYKTTPTGVYKSGVLNANTSLPPTNDGSYDSTCPVNSYGATNCFKFRAQRIPCQDSATTQQKTESPCSWDATKGSLFQQPLQIGDVFFDGLGDTERFMVLSVTDVGGGLAEMVAMRDAALSYCVASNQTTGQKTHANSWVMLMGINRNGCDSGLFLMDVATGVILEGARVDFGGSHYDIGAGNLSTTVNVNTCGGGNGNGIASEILKANVVDPLLHQSLLKFNGFTDGTLINATQCYPSIRGSLTDHTIFNYNHYNASFGATDYPPNAISGGVTATLQGGTTAVYKLTILGTGAEYRSVPLHVWAGKYLLRDLSSPTLGNTLTDANLCGFCYSFKAGECRSGSNAAELYAVIPKADLTGQANVNSFGQRAPAATWMLSYTGWITQTRTTDYFGNQTRRLTMAMVMPGWAEAFSNARILPDGKRFVFHMQLPGKNRELWSAKLDNWPAQGAADVGYRKVPITLPVVAGLAQVRIGFGYTDYGTASQMYCTPRTEKCYADGVGNPFNFSQDSTVWANCNSGSSCTIPVPLIPGRTAFIQVERGNSNTLVISEPVKIISVR